VPYSQIWIPDLFLYDAADIQSWNVWQTNSNLFIVKLKYKLFFSSFIFFVLDVYATILSNGSVTVSPPVILSNSCPLDISKFPFDSKSCIFRFGR
jgi:hypothetical protein